MEDQITLERIQQLHPRVRHEVLAAYKHMNNNLLGKFVRLRFTHTLRTFEEQAALYALGRTVANSAGKTARRPKGNIVTNAKGGQSIHNYGLALSIVLDTYIFRKERDNIDRQLSGKRYPKLSPLC